MNPRKSYLTEAEARSPSLRTTRLVLLDSVPSLADVDMTLGELQTIIDKFVQLHGPKARLRADAGHNNVNFELYYEVSAEEMKTFLATKDAVL